MPQPDAPPALPQYGYPSATQKLRNQVSEPPQEIVSLDDYRRRHRELLLDQSLQLLNSRVPLIALTDDHDTVNNAWMTGAENHQPYGAFVGRHCGGAAAGERRLPPVPMASS